MEGGVAHTESWVLCKPWITLQECLSLLEISITSCRNQSLTGRRATKGIAHPNNSPPLLEHLPCCLSTTCFCTCFGYPWQIPSSSTNAGMKRKMKTRMLRMGGGSASFFCIAYGTTSSWKWVTMPHTARIQTLLHVEDYEANSIAQFQVASKSHCHNSWYHRECPPPGYDLRKQARAPNWNRKRGYKSDFYSKETRKWVGGCPGYLSTDKQSNRRK